MPGAALRAEAPTPAVSLLLTKVSSERAGQDTRFTCHARLVNGTGEDVTARSNFSGVLFDGLEVVVTSKEGTVLAQQPYIYHQSPFLETKDAVLKKGVTVDGKLVFPVRGLPPKTTVVKVRLVGTLPNSTYKRILSSETIEVDIRK
jgi:hypothetical protein